MEPDAVVRMVEEEVPFNHLVGATAIAVNDHSASYRLPLRPELANHLRTLHAAALFTLAEGTSGSLVAAAFPIEQYILVLKNAEIKYRNLATSATSSASIDLATRERLQQHLAETGRADIPVHVVVHNEHGQVACEMTCVWALRSRAEVHGA